MSERMTDEQIDKLNELLEATTTPGGTLAVNLITQLRADLAAARKKNQELNRREQKAMAAYRSAEKAIENAKQGDGFRWASGNLGRAFLAFDNREIRKRLAAANEIVERQRGERAGAERGFEK